MKILNWNKIVFVHTFLINLSCEYNKNNSSNRIIKNGENHATHVIFQINKTKLKF